MGRRKPQQWDEERALETVERAFREHFPESVHAVWGESATVVRHDNGRVALPVRWSVSLRLVTAAGEPVGIDPDCVLAEVAEATGEVLWKASL